MAKVKPIAEIYFRGEKDNNVIPRLKKGITRILKGLPKFQRGINPF